MFMLSSIRKDMAEAFYTDDAVAWSTMLRESPGAAAAKAPSVPALSASPLLVDVVLPLNDASLEAACAACESAAARYVGWMQGAEILDQRRIMLTFAHDSKVRAMCLSVATQGLEGRFGAAGQLLASADAGPMDITDRGSAQNAAASTNFDAGEKDASALDMQRLVDEGQAMPYGGGDATRDPAPSV